MKNPIVSKIKRAAKEKIKKRIEDSNVVGNLVRSNLGADIKETSENVVGKNLEKDLARVMMNKSKGRSYEILKEEVKKNTKQELSNYTTQKSKEVLNSTIKRKKKEKH